MKHEIEYGKKLYELLELANTMDEDAAMSFEDMDDLEEAAMYVKDKAEELRLLLQELVNARRGA